MAICFREEVVPAMSELRAPIDALEEIVEKELWPVPTYGDLLFEV
jgi:glutamine synthetase